MDRIPWNSRKLKPPPSWNRIKTNTRTTNRWYTCTHHRHGIGRSIAPIHFGLSSGPFPILGKCEPSISIKLPPRTDTLFTVAMTSDATREIWLQEAEANVRKKGRTLAAKFGKLEALQWLHVRDCGSERDVCQAAAADGHFHIL